MPDEKSKLDRELMELLNELRVALPGIQVLFAFLFTVPFTRRFDDLTDLQRTTFFVAFIAAAAAATILLIAPSANHRLRWRERDKEKLLQRANVMTIAGLAAAFALAWYVLPLSRKLRDQER